MAYLSRTRMFDGKRYRLHDDYLMLRIASWEADKLRSKGWSIRMVSVAGLYGVYKRRK